MYESLEKEGVEEDKHLSSVHQQRIQLEVNEQKRHAMESYVAALNEEQPSVREPSFHSTSYLIQFKF